MRYSITLSIFLLASTASAQLVSFGVKGGAELTSRTRFNDQSRWYLVGPSIEFRLPAHFAVETGALYMRLGQPYAYSFNDQTTGVTTNISGHTRGNAWEFPILGKYYFGGTRERVRPFAGTGYTFRTIWFDDTFLSSTSPAFAPDQTHRYSAGSRGPLEVGALFAAGVRVRTGRVFLTPEVRYVRWGSTGTIGRKDEAKMLIGISF